MRQYLENTIKSLKNFSKSLDKKSILIEKPWALVDSDLEIQKLIFKKNHELIMSKDGQVSMGRWEYLAQAKSLLIDRGDDKILCNEAFIDDGVLILKLDGTSRNFFVLANENIIPDLDVFEYLKRLRYRNFSIREVELIGEKTLEIIQGKNYRDDLLIGKKVTIDSEGVVDGIYETRDHTKKYKVLSGKISSLVYDKSYNTRDGIQLTIEQRSELSPSKGDSVWINGRRAEDGEYRLVAFRNIIVKDGKILRKKLF